MHKATIKTWIRRIVVGLFLSSTAMFGLWSLEQATLAQVTNTAEPRTNQTTFDQIRAQLIGRWQVAFAEDEIPFSFILAPNGELLALDPQGEAIRFSWTLESIDQQPTLMADLGLFRLVGMAFNTDSMTLRLIDQTPGHNQFRQERTINAQKLSSDPSLPAEFTVINAAEYYQQQAITARQHEARNQVQQLNRAQQSYFLTHQQFADDTQTIRGLFIPPSTYYDYQIILSDAGQVANILALPTQPGFIAYFGRVTRETNSPNPAVTTAILCESTAPTVDAPTSIPALQDSELLCPEGYAVPIARIGNLNNPGLVQAVETQASNYLGTISRSQQAILLEEDRFEGDIQTMLSILGFDIQNGNYYDYQIVLSEDGNTANILAIPKHEQLRTLIGRTGIVMDEITHELITITLAMQKH